MAETCKYVTFRTGSEYYGLKIEYVKEIVVLQEIIEVPESKDYIKGLINLRGTIIPVIDVRLRLKKEAVEYDDRTCIIVLNVDSTLVGLIVEKIAEVVEIKAEDIIEAPSVGNAQIVQNGYVYAIGKVGKAVKLLIDPAQLLKYTELPELDLEAEDNENKEWWSAEIEDIADDMTVDNKATVDSDEAAEDEEIAKEPENEFDEGESQL